LPRRPVLAHEGRLRVGYLSADFHQHATSQLAVQMFEAHDRARFEVTLFSAGPDDGTPLRQRMRVASEHFVELHGQDTAAMAAAIRERAIDILVDVKGATYGSVMQVMAHRPAPLQVNWLGFPGTSGADYIDYLIGDPIVTPLAHAIIYFVIVAATIYFLVIVPVNHLAERRKRGEEPEVQAPSEEILLLQEIRDLLRQRSI